MTDIQKFVSAINTLKSGAEWIYFGTVMASEDHFNNVKWITDSNGTQSDTCPHSEITWTKVKAEMDKL
tara:strand:+ start:722 stop:925 length:204 start_codon:yes stop_codon:yes gene_type:complete